MEHTLRADGAGTVRRRPRRARRSRSTSATCSWRWSRRERGRRPLGAARSPTAAASSATASAPPARWSRAARIDVLTGDWLAELTMYILHKTRQRSGGYARTFLRELEEVLPTCIERGITVVANAGGLDPEGLATAVRELARRQGVEVRVASVSGDDITAAARRAAGRRRAVREPRHRRGAARPGAPVVTANAYLRARPIADALAAGRPGGGDRAGDRRRARRRAGAARLRLGRRRPRRHRRRRGGGPRDRVRGAVLRRQLRVLRGDPGPGADRLPDRRAARPTGRRSSRSTPAPAAR